MSDEDLAETLWREFAVETEEHFEIIEPLLVAAETQAIATGDIAQLFRSFHSVKGLSRAMDMRGMEEVAHNAENLLGLVRDGTTPLDGEAAALLLEAVDALKGLRETALTERSNASPPDGLIGRLEQVHAARAGHPASPAPTTPAPAPPPSPEPRPQSATEAPALGPDPDMLRFYGEMIEQHLPAITSMATVKITEASARDAAREGIEALLHATGVMGFEGLAESLEILRTLLGGEPNDDVRFRVTDALGHIRSEIELIERELHAEIAGPALADRLSEALQAEVHAIVDGIMDVLSRFAGGEARSAESDEGLAAELAGLTRTACTFFLFLKLQQASRLMLMVEDIFTRVAGHEMYLYPELLVLTREVAALLTEVADGLGHWSDLDESTVGQILDRFRQALLVGSKEGAGADPVSALKRVLNDYDIGVELVEILSAENIQDMIAAVRGGRSNIYEIMAHLEGDEQMTLAFVEWVSHDATAITNRTVIVDGKTWFEFLIVSHLDTAQIEARVAAINPDGQNIRVRSCAAKAAAASAISTPAGGGRKPPEGKTAGGGAQAKGSNVLRVRGETVDQLMAQVGEMVTIGNMLKATVSGGEIEGALARLRAMACHDNPQDVRALTVIEGALRAILSASDNFGGAVERLQDATLELRVVPIDTLFSRFSRVMRDIAQAKGKQVRLETEGAEVRIDKGMVDLLLDPLMHMVRNAVDHGVEMPDEREKAGKSPVARVRLSAVSRGNRVEIEVSDDGKGLDVERIRAKAIDRGLVGAAEAARLSTRQVTGFIFAPGFSTAEQVTETSGRGVGMDVVRTNILRLGGTIEVDTRPGEGSTITLQLPLSAAIQRVLMVEAAGKMLAIPERFLAEVHDAAANDIQLVRGRPAIVLRDEFLPIFHLTDLLGFRRAGGDDPVGRRSSVVLANGRHRIGVEVDRLHRRQELFVKEIHPSLAAIPGVGGASIAGDGKVVLIVDGDDLFRLAQSSPAATAIIH